MPRYLHPGVYIEEIPSGSRPIEGVATSVAAFVGAANRGPVGELVLVGKFEDYAQDFGSIVNEQDDMGLAVMAFYLNRGKAAYICRLALAGHLAASVELPGEQLDTTAVSPIMTISATSSGTWANNYFVLISNADTATRTFDLEVGIQDTLGDFEALVGESFAGLSMDDTSEDYVELQVNGVSSIVEVSVAAGIPGDSAPLDTAVTGISLSTTVVGVANALVAADYSAFYGSTLRKVQDVSIILLPGQQGAADSSSNAAISATQAHCEPTKSRVVIIYPPPTLVLAQAATVTTMALPTSTYTSLYYPWVDMANPLYNEDLVPVINQGKRLKTGWDENYMMKVLSVGRLTV
jgi:hypothetical protein